MKKCEDCGEYVYICEGDFACMREEPKIILVDFPAQTDDYGRCRGKHKDD